MKRKRIRKSWSPEENTALAGLTTKAELKNFALVSGRSMQSLYSRMKRLKEEEANPKVKGRRGRRPNPKPNTTTTSGTQVVTIKANTYNFRGYKSIIVNEHEIIVEM